MPGKRITDHQLHTYKQHRNQLSQVASAVKAGISERSAERIEQALSLRLAISCNDTLSRTCIRLILPNISIVITLHFPCPIFGQGK